jgi:hypothetical protein
MAKNNRPRMKRSRMGQKRVSLAKQQEISVKAWSRTIMEVEEKKQAAILRKRAVKRIRKKARGFITSIAISPRHRADLIEPFKAFTDDRMKAGHGLLSTAIVSFEYYPEQEMLILVWWKDWKKGIAGPAYAYFSVPFDVYEGLLKASSKGRYVYYNIRTSFKYKRLG